MCVNVCVWVRLQLNAGVHSFSRKFIGEVRRCEELERKLRYIAEEMKKDGVTAPQPCVLPRALNPKEVIELEVRAPPLSIPRPAERGVSKLGSI